MDPSRRRFLGLAFGALGASALGLRCGNESVEDPQCPISNSQQSKNFEHFVIANDQTIKVEKTEKSEQEIDRYLEIIKQEPNPLEAEADNFNCAKVRVSAYLGKNNFASPKEVESLPFASVEKSLPGALKDEYKRIYEWIKNRENERLFTDRKNKIFDVRGIKKYFSSYLENEDKILPIIFAEIEQFEKQEGLKIPYKIILGVLFKEYPSSLSYVSFNEQAQMDPKVVYRQLYKKDLTAEILENPAGPFQLDGLTARTFGLEVSMENDERYCFPKALRAAMYKLKGGYDHFANQWGLAATNYCSSFGKNIKRLEKLFGQGLFRIRRAGKFGIKDEFDSRGVNLLTAMSKNMGGLAETASFQYAMGGNYLANEVLFGQAVRDKRTEIRKNRHHK